MGDKFEITAKYINNDRVLLYTPLGSMTDDDLEQYCDTIKQRYDDPRHAQTKVYLSDLDQADFTAMSSAAMQQMAEFTTEIRDPHMDSRPLISVAASDLTFGLSRIRGQSGKQGIQYETLSFRTMAEAEAWIAEYLRNLEE